MKYKDNILASNATALVNPVNTRGVMGAGLAKQFKQAYPRMFVDYQTECRGGRMGVGQLHTYQEKGKHIINLPTKDHWQDPSKLEYIESGLEALVTYAKNEKLASLAVPPLGTGLGGLSQDEVFPLMEEKLQEIANNGTRVVFYHPEGAYELNNDVEMSNDVREYCDPRLEQLHALSDKQLEQFHKATQTYLDVKGLYDTDQVDTDIALDKALSAQVLELRNGDREAIDRNYAIMEGNHSAISRTYLKMYFENQYYYESDTDHSEYMQQLEQSSDIANSDNDTHQLNPVFLRIAKKEAFPVLSETVSEKLHDQWIDESPKLKAMTVRMNDKSAWLSGTDALATIYDGHEDLRGPNTPEAKQRVIHALWLEKSMHSVGDWKPDGSVSLTNLRENGDNRLTIIMDAYSTDLDTYRSQFEVAEPAIERALVVEKSHHMMTTGHRPDKMVGPDKGWGYLETEESRRLYHDMRTIIHERMEEKGHVTVHSGMSQGADAIFAHAALAEREENPGRVALHCDIPFEGQESKWSKKVQDRYNAVREQADSETVYGPSYANKWYAVRNQGMVDAADECTAVYNGVDNDGGTRMTVNMILASGKPHSYLGGYVMRTQTISAEVAEHTYAPTKESRDMLAQLSVVTKPTLAKENAEKQQALDLYKSMQRNRRPASTPTSNKEYSVDGIEI